MSSNPQNNSLSLYPFSLRFNGIYARFSFIYKGISVASPSCLISARDAGDMGFKGTHSPERKSFFSLVGIQAENVYSLIQVHSKDVFALPDFRNSSATAITPETFAREGDGMVCLYTEADLADTPSLAVTVADCLPVFLLDTENGFYSIVHSGWKGTGIALKALKIMQDAGTKPETVAAILGPCIQNCCYQVEEDRAKIFKEEFGADSVRHDHSGFYLNLQAANTRLLSDAGVQHIAYCPDCTFTDTRLGSFRRQGPKDFTRMIAMITGNKKVN